MKHCIKLENGIEILHSNKPKDRQYLWNTMMEFRVGSWMLENTDPKAKFILDCTWTQDQGDFTFNNASFEFKENRGALSSGYISLEVLNTTKCEPSGLLKSVNDQVNYFLMYFPVYRNYNGHNSDLIDTMLLFKTNELYHWVRNRDEITASNNNTQNSNALCYKVPARYITDCESFKELIIKQWHIPEYELKAIDIPTQLYGLFKDE